MKKSKYFTFMDYKQKNSERQSRIKILNLNFEIKTYFLVLYMTHFNATFISPSYTRIKKSKGITT